MVSFTIHHFITKTPDFELEGVSHQAYHLFVVITLACDRREEMSGIPSTLTQIPWIRVIRAPLAVGDYQIGRFTIERKSGGDLLASLSSGRLFRQIENLYHAPSKPILLIEHGGFPSKGVEASFVQKVLKPIQEEWIIPIVRTENVEGTVEFILGLAAREAGFAYSDPGDRHAGKNRYGDHDAPRYLLESIPGIGPAFSEKLLNAFGTPQAVFRATESRLKKVIGPARALRLRRIYRGNTSSRSQ